MEVDSSGNFYASSSYEFEILNALKSIKPFKAPNLDSIHVRFFFQRFWMIVGEFVKVEEKNIYAINASLVSK